MKVIVMGGGIDRAEVVRALRNVSNSERLEIIDASEIENKDNLELVQLEQFKELQIEDAFNFSKPKQSNQWRGGSRGKGGKTKWPRR